MEKLFSVQGLRGLPYGLKLLCSTTIIDTNYNDPGGHDVRKIIALLMLILIFGGCKKEQIRTGQPAAPGQTAGDDGSPLPTVNFAEIVAIDPRADKPMIAQYQLTGGEGGAVTVTCRWYVGGAVVEGVTGNMLDPQYFRKGERVEVEVIPTDGARMGVPYRTPAVTVRNTPPVADSVLLRPVPAFAGDTITAAATASDGDNDSVSFEYQWYVNNSPVPNTSAELRTEGLKKKDGISVTATPYDGDDRGTPAQSTVVFLSNRNPEITSTPPAALQNGMFTYQVAAKDPDGDPISFSLVSAPSGMTIDPRTGLVRWEPPRDVSGRVDMQVRIAADDGDGGMSYQEFGLGLEMK